MLIVCPSCASQYSLEPDRIGPAGRKVRCAACRESWFVSAASLEGSSRLPADDLAFEEQPDIVQPPADAPAAQAVEEPQPVVIESAAHAPGRQRHRPARHRSGRRRPDRPAAARPGSHLVRSRLAVAAALVLAAGAALLPLRVPLVRAVPGTGSLFAALGMPVNVTGLAFARVTSSLSRATDRPVLLVAGDIANVSGTTLPVPGIEITVRGDSGETLYSWSIAAAEREVAAGASVPFEARLASPPPAGRRVDVALREKPRVGAVASR